GQHLNDEVGHDPAVIGPHPGSERIEDANDADVDAVVAVVRHRHRLGEPLGLVVHAAWSDRVDVTPVVLGLRVDLRVDVHLAGGRQQEAGTLGLGQAERLVGSEASDLQRLDRVLQVVDRGGRTGEVEHRVDRPGDMDVVGDVVVDEREPGSAHEVLDVVEVAGDEVVDRDDLVATIEQRTGEMGPEEAGTTCHDDSHRQRPTPSYVKPPPRSATGSSRFRASTTRGASSASATLAKSTVRNSSHSVSTTTAAAP